MMLRFIWASARKDALRARRDPFGILIWIGIPLILGGLITAVFGRGQATPQGRLLVVDEDDSFVSNVLTSTFSREPMSKMVLIEKVSREEGRARIDRGDGSGLLIIPKGLADATLRNEPYRLELLTNPSQRIMPNLIKAVLSVTVEAEFYLHQVAGPELLAIGQQQNQDGIPTDLEVAQYSVAFNHVADGLRKYLFPTHRTADHHSEREHFREEPRGRAVSDLHLHGRSVYLQRVSRRHLERAQRRRPAPLVHDAHASVRVSGRMRPPFVALIFAGVGLMGVAVARWLASVPVAYFAGAVLWLIFSGSCFFRCCCCWCSKLRRNAAPTHCPTWSSFPWRCLEVAFFRLTEMPAWMVRIGSKTPNGWAVIQFNALLDGSVNREKLALAAAGLLIAGGVAFVLALRKLPRFAL